LTEIGSPLSEIMKQVEQLYLNHTELYHRWHNERPVIEKLLHYLIETEKYYELGRPIAASNAIIFEVRDPNLNVKRALKIARPHSVLSKYFEPLATSEAQNLASLTHANIMKLYRVGVAEADAVKSPYYIMEYIEGAVDIDRYITDTPRLTSKTIVGLFSGIVSAISHMHNNNIVHLDIKPANIFVGPNNEAIVADFGLSKKIKTPTDTTRTIVGGTIGYMHPELATVIRENKTSKDYFIGEVPSAKIATRWDHYALGVTITELLSLIAKRNRGELSNYESQYLRLFAWRLLDGQAQDAEPPLGLQNSVFHQIKYQNLSESIEDLGKLSGSYNLEVRIPELSLNPPASIQSTSVAITAFTSRVRTVCEHPLISRLQHVTQLGPVNLIYPTARHSRLEHTLGTFSVLCRYLSALYYDPVNPLFRQIMTEVDLKASLLAALLHDIGQHPMAHDISEAAPGLPSHEKIGFDAIIANALGKL
jgi:serine/threonine protein kinase